MQLIGYGVSLTGKTYPVKEQIKKLGFTWDGLQWGKLYPTKAEAETVAAAINLPGVEVSIHPVIEAGQEIWEEVAAFPRPFGPVPKKGQPVRVIVREKWAIKRGLISA